MLIYQEIGDARTFKTADLVTVIWVCVSELERTGEDNFSCGGGSYLFGDKTKGALTLEYA